MVAEPLTVALNLSVFVVPADTIREGGEVRVTIGAGMMVTVDVADNPGSSYDTAATLTVADGTDAGAWYRPLESILPTVSSPPVFPLTCQVITLLVPPETAARNCCVVTTFTDAVTGAIVMTSPVVGSLHDDEEVAEDVVAVVVVQVIAVLAGE